MDVSASDPAAAEEPDELKLHDDLAGVHDPPGRAEEALLAASSAMGGFRRPRSTNG